MRIWALVCCAVASLSANAAFAAQGDIAITDAADLAGKNSGKSVTSAVRDALTGAQLSVAPEGAVVKAAKAAKVKPKGLKAALAGKLAAKGKFGAVVAFRKGKNGIFAQLVDARGQVVLERMIHVTKGNASGDDALAFGTAVQQALGGGAPPPPPAPAAQAAPPPPPPPPPPAAAPAPAPADTGPSNATPGAMAGPSDESPKEGGNEPAAGFLMRVGLLGGVGTRTFLAPGFAYTTKTPYPAGGISFEVFPVASLALGIVGDLSMGFVEDDFNGNSTYSFTSEDIRADLALAYRWKIFQSPYGTTLIPRFGIGLRRFDPPSTADGQQVGIASDNRFFLEGGLQFTQPILPQYLRLTAGAQILPLASMSAAGQAFFNEASGLGIQWMAELGGDIAFGLEWALQVDQERFMDSYNTPVKDTGVEVETMYTVQLRFHL